MGDQITRRSVLAVGAAAAGGLILGAKLGSAAEVKAKKRVLVWAEGTAPKNVYPKDINGAIAEGLQSLEGWEVVTAGLADPDQGVSDESLKKTDVLIWWGHQKHGDVKDDLVKRIVARVKEEGMGFISVHSSHFAKPYKALMGTACSWKWYVVDNSNCKVIVKMPDHPISKGVRDFTLPKTERYGEPFAVPAPEAVPLDGLYTKPDGTTEQSRQGLCWTIGKGRVFYFQVGHETFPDLMRDDVRLVLRNAVQWAARTV